MISKNFKDDGTSVDGKRYRLQAIADKVDGENLSLILPGQGFKCIIRAVQNKERDLCEKIIYNGLPIAVAVSILATYIIYMCWHYGTWGRADVNGPIPIPILGNWAYRLGNKRIDDIDIERRQLYGDIYGVYEPREPILVISNPTLVKEILVDNDKNMLHSSKFQSKHQPYATLNELTEDSNWRMVRMAMKNSINAEKMMVMRCSLEEAGKNIVNNLKKIMDTNGRIDMKQIAHHFAMDILARIGFGIKLDSMSEKDSMPFVKNVAILLKYSGPESKGRVAFKHFCPFLADSVNKYNENTLPVECRLYFMQLVEKAMCRPMKVQCMLKDLAELTRIAHDPEIRPCKHWTSKGFTQEEVAAQCMFFIQNSYSPIVSAITLICYYLTEYPQVQADVIREIDNTLKAEPELIPEHGSLNNVVNEVFRLHPPANRIERYVSRDFTLSDGTRINRGMTIRIPIKTIHTDDELWENGKEFIPRRFDDDETAAFSSKKTIKFLPFGAGERCCMGEVLAREAIDCAIIYILLNHELSVFSPLDLRPRVDQYGRVESGTVLRKARERAVLVRMSKQATPNEDEASLYSIATPKSENLKKHKRKSSGKNGCSFKTTKKNSAAAAENNNRYGGDNSMTGQTTTTTATANNTTTTSAPAYTTFTTSGTYFTDSMTQYAERKSLTYPPPQPPLKQSTNEIIGKATKSTQYQVVDGGDLDENGSLNKRRESFPKQTNSAFPKYMTSASYNPTGSSYYPVTNNPSSHSYYNAPSSYDPVYTGSITSSQLHHQRESGNYNKELTTFQSQQLSSIKNVVRDDKDSSVGKTMSNNRKSIESASIRGSGGLKEEKQSINKSDAAAADDEYQNEMEKEENYNKEEISDDYDVQAMKEEEEIEKIIMDIKRTESSPKMKLVSPFSNQSMSSAQSRGTFESPNLRGSILKTYDVPEGYDKPPATLSGSRLPTFETEEKVELKDAIFANDISSAQQQQQQQQQQQLPIEEEMNNLINNIITNDVHTPVYREEENERTVVEKDDYDEENEGKDNINSNKTSSRNKSNHASYPFSRKRSSIPRRMTKVYLKTISEKINKQQQQQQQVATSEPIFIENRHHHNRHQTNANYNKNHTLEKKSSYKTTSKSKLNSRRRISKSSKIGNNYKTVRQSNTLINQFGFEKRPSARGSGSIKGEYMNRVDLMRDEVNGGMIMDTMRKKWGKIYD